MEIQKSRNGFYTLTFYNRNNIDEQEIYREFSTVGNVCKVVQNFQRVFIRFKEKEEAERALKKFKKIYDVDMAKNSKIGENNHPESEFSFYHQTNHKTNQSAALLPATEDSTVTNSPDQLGSGNKIFHFILGCLPKNYTVQDVKALVEEAKPVCINQIEETRVFNIKFCHIVLDTLENLYYLIDKLNGFVICGEKLIAAEAKNLLEWREQPV